MYPRPIVCITMVCLLQHPKPLPKGGKFQYGNYNRYYGYRNSGVNEVDPRLALLRKEWVADKDCLDIGCNTGQVSVTSQHPDSHVMVV
jgi:hypothetical protein